MSMENHKKMYIELFNKVTDAIRELQEAQKNAEQFFMDNKFETL